MVGIQRYAESQVSETNEQYCLYHSEKKFTKSKLLFKPVTFYPHLYLSIQGKEHYCQVKALYNRHATNPQTANQKTLVTTEIKINLHRNGL